MTNWPLPPTNSLKAFDLAARELSFTRAAEALGVTQAAVSLQIKALEDHIRIKLFVRSSSGVQLTSAGEELWPVVSRAIEDMALTIKRLKEKENENALTVSVFNSFAARWLVPRIGEFLASNPNIEMKLDSSNRIVDLGRENFDLCVRFGTGSWSDARVEPFISETLMPVCSPRLLQSHKGVADRVLAEASLLEDETCDGRTDGWSLWFAQTERAEMRAKRPRVIFSDSGLLIQAAIEGQGVALGRRALIARDIESRRLVPLAAEGMVSPYNYFLCFPKHRPIEKKALVRFKTWLRRQAVN